MNENLEATARREFHEEVGLEASGPLYALGSVTQKGGKEVHAWAFESSLPPNFTLSSNMFSVQCHPVPGAYSRFQKWTKCCCSHLKRSA